jgi:hypothetical protein|tara:strand:+ start:1480 stop:2100 length:621 start_codon:yes stop_codon:yes gene_type:complete
MIGGSVIAAGQASAAEKLSHAHMGHVTTAWNDTPDGQGLLPTAIAEAKIAAQHAAFAIQKPSDLAWMKLHAAHVLNAVDATLQAKGPGLGYGVVKAAGGTAKHINFAANSDDASDNVRAHARHVATAAQNTLARAAEIAALCQKVSTADNAEQAAALMQQVATLGNQLLAGVDANGDGAISWEQGEGGLNIANQHMGFMEQGEGMN